MRHSSLSFPASTSRTMSERRLARVRAERLRASRRCCLQLAALVLLGRKPAARYVETGHLNAHNHCDRLFAQTRVGLLTVPANQSLKGRMRCRITYDSVALNGHLELFLWA